MSSRPLHRVSCKVAIYSTTGESVLVMKYPQLGPNAYGLPGGHLEPSEDPDAAVVREFQEETGLAINLKVQRRDFWMHEDGKVLLGYTATADFDLPPAPDPSFEIAQWQKIADIKASKINMGSYNDFVIKNQQKLVK